MSEVIIDVIQITAANDWYIANDVFASEAKDLAELEPIALFALVSTFNPEFPTCAPSKMTVALTCEHIAEDIVGKNVSEFPDQLIHRSHF